MSVSATPVVRMLSVSTPKEVTSVAVSLGSQETLSPPAPTRTSAPPRAILVAPMLCAETQTRALSANVPRGSVETATLLAKLQKSELFANLISTAPTMLFVRKENVCVELGSRQQELCAWMLTNAAQLRVFVEQTLCAETPWAASHAPASHLLWVVHQVCHAQVKTNIFNQKNNEILFFQSLVKV